VEKAKKVTYKALGMSMGIVNIIVGAFGGMPMCHGTGGMAAHYRFGARTAGSNIIIGTIFVVLALLFGKVSVSLLTSIPASVLGVLLLFAGLELALLVRDLKNINDYFISLLIAGIAVATTNMSYAFIAGISVKYIIDTMKIRL
ncbi:MAG TPA: sulfate permease, partial [Euryarchaeota archaeon]|nr:sulfate permease [Euryarchaeota archaeon]